MQDISELAQKPPLKYIASEDLWLDMVTHWSTPEQRAKSKQGVAARLSTGGRDGKISKSGCGRVSVVDRVLREVKLWFQILVVILYFLYEFLLIISFTRVDREDRGCSPGT